MILLGSRSLSLLRFEKCHSSLPGLVPGAGWPRVLPALLAAELLHLFIAQLSEEMGVSAPLFAEQPLLGSSGWSESPLQPVWGAAVGQE